MPVDSALFIAVSLLFGGGLGFALGLRASDRRPALWSTGAATAVGVACWAAWLAIDQPGDMLGSAAVALTLGCGAAFLVTLLVGRRPSPT